MRAVSAPTSRPTPVWHRFVAAAALGLLVVGGGWVLSQATTRVVNWYVMTDELLYERLGISVAQTGSLLPRLRGERIDNINQLYPVLLSFVYGNGDVPASLVAAHRMNAFVMVSAAVPVYLLARRIDVGRLASLWVAGLSIAMPWIVLSSFLLTEVVAYPVFCWSVLALSVAVQRKSTRWDAVALGSIGLAVLARTQFAVLLIVFAVAVLTEAVLESVDAGERGADVPRSAASRLVRTRRVLVALYAAGAVVLVATHFLGGASALLGTYSVTASGIHLDGDLVRLTLKHLASLALATGILPFVVGTAWLIDNVRPSAAPAARAFASVGCATVLLVALEVASFNQRFGAGEVKDRYLFYVLPIVLVGLGAAIVGRAWPPRWAWAAPLLIVVAGLASLPLPVYEKLNVDSPVATLNDTILRITGSIHWAHVLLPLAAVVLVGVLVELSVFFPRRVGQVALVVLATLALPGGSVYAFDRLFAVNGTNSLPITFDQGVVFNWVDRGIGSRGGTATVFPYPVNSPDYWAGVAYWWDAEFWNESVVALREFPSDGQRDAPWTDMFDLETGAVLEPGTTRYVVSHGSDVRFQLAGGQVAFERGAYLREASVPWRAEWITDQIYNDGWTKPHVPVRIHVYAEPGQRTPLRRFLTVSVASPSPTEPRPLTIRSNLDLWRGLIPPDQSIDHSTSVCVPPGGHADVEIETPYVSDVYRDPTVAPLTGETDRPVGVLVRSIALADETEPLDACPGAPVDP
jgi:hypothetical protein